MKKKALHFDTNLMIDLLQIAVLLRVSISSFIFESLVENL